MNTLRELDWKSIFGSLLYTIILGMVIGFVWGVVGVILFFGTDEKASEDIISTILTPTGYIIGFLVSQIPLVLGTLHLLSMAQQNEQKHCIVFGLIYIVFTISMMIMLDPEDNAMGDYFYLLSIIPVILLTKKFADR